MLVVLFVLTLISTDYFVFGGQSYDINDSKQYAILSGLAFCGRECISNWSCGWSKNVNLTNLTYIQHPLTKAAGYIGFYPSKNIIVASFRGSNNIQNWIEDLNFEKVPYLNCKNCQIHSGFYADYLLIESEVNKAVQTILSSHPTATILTTGHSLGAAISSICGLQLKLKFSKTVNIHNFGCPRVGNQEFSRFLTQKVDSIFRVVHYRDIVPHLPPDVIQYHHPPYQIFFNEENTQYKICSSSGQDITCSNKFAPNYNPNDHDFYFIHISQTQC